MLAVFGIDNDGLNLAVNLLILFLVVIWLALVYWTYADARRRIDDPMLVGCATAASLFPFVGTIVYMIVRPPEYLEDVRERELEMQAAEARLHGAATCCARTATTRSRRTSCAARTACASSRTPCPNCRKPLDPGGDLPVLRGRDPGQDADRRAAAGAASRPTRGRPSRSPSQPLQHRVPKEPRMDRTLILVKPDAFARGLTGEIIARFERKGLRIVALKHMTTPRDLAEHALRRARGASRSSASSSTSSPRRRWWRWCSRATRRSSAARQVIGATNPLEAAPGSIRGDFAHRGRPEHGPRLGLAGVGGARDRDLFPEL